MNEGRCNEILCLCLLIKDRHARPAISRPSSIIIDAILALFKQRVIALRKMSHSNASEHLKGFRLAKVDIVVVSDMIQLFGYGTLV